MGTRILLGILFVVITAAVVAGVLVLGSPTTQRELRLDERRVRDLEEIANAVDIYRLKHKDLPASMQTLVAERPWSPAPLDPMTAQSYEYRVLDQDRYELCAVFQRRSNAAVTSWQHGAGRTCFTRRAGK